MYIFVRLSLIVPESIFLTTKHLEQKSLSHAEGQHKTCSGRLNVKEVVYRACGQDRVRNKGDGLFSLVQI